MLWQVWEHKYIYCTEVNCIHVVGEAGQGGGREGRKKAGEKRERRWGRERGEGSAITHRGDNQCSGKYPCWSYLFSQVLMK